MNLKPTSASGGSGAGRRSWKGSRSGAATSSELVFARRITRRTPGRFSTRGVTRGTERTLKLTYKHSSIRQYFKAERALRTETTINDARDFGLGRRLHDLPALREIGLAANRRLIDVQRLAQRCAVPQAARGPPAGACRRAARPPAAAPSRAPGGLSVDRR